MGWVNRNEYNPGVWHRVRSRDAVTVREVKLTDYDLKRTDENRIARRFSEKVIALCGAYVGADGYESVKGTRHGGVHFTEKVSLITKNVCTKCRKTLLDENPDLKAAADLLAKGAS